MIDLFIEWEHALASLQLTLAMLGMGMTLRPRDFADIVVSPSSVVLILIGQMILAPLLAIGISKAMGLPSGIAFGLIVITAMPGGALSNIYAYLGRGNIPLSITATTVATGLCVVTTPLLLRVYSTFAIPESFSMPIAHLISEIVLFLLLPLLAGMAFLRFFAKHALLAQKILVRCTLALVAVYITGALASGRLEIWQYGWKTPVGIALFVAILLLGTIQGARLLGCSRKDASTVGIEIVIRNAFLALLIKTDLFPASEEVHPMEQATLYVILFYGGASLVFGMSPVIINRLVMRKESDDGTSDSDDPALRSAK